jgi:curli biogenesis system outer membrane secretion channel CsgG
MEFTLKWVRSVGAIVLCLGLLSSPPLAFAQAPAQVDNSPSAQQLQQVKRSTRVKPVVAIYEFRSAVPEVQVRAAQEMFTTALVRSGTFAVAERQRLNEGVMRERQLNAAGHTTGDVAGATLAGARYVLEVVVSEANAGEKESSSNINVGGLNVANGSASDSIGMDVRIIDASSGLVIDAINVVKKLESSATNVSGVGRLAQSLSGLRGKPMLPVPVDADVRSGRKDGVDRALRSCIEVAVAELARRYGAD